MKRKLLIKQRTRTIDTYVFYFLTHFSLEFIQLLPTKAKNKGKFNKIGFSWVQLRNPSVLAE